MNHVLILTRNTLQLTSKCIASALAQDCGDIVIDLIDNDSTDGTFAWAETEVPMPHLILQFIPQIGVSAGWNVGLSEIFDAQKEDHALVVNSDTVLPPWFYSMLLSYDVPFVTGVSVESMEEIAAQPPRKELVERPDLSAFLIGRECWQRVGTFDETMVHYCGDLDYHIRAYRQGMHLMNAGVPFYHERSSTLKSADKKDRRRIEFQADADRDRLFDKWGVHAGSHEYNDLFSADNFGIDHPMVKEMQDL